jgi:hypothetical protein
MGASPLLLAAIDSASSVKPGGPVKPDGTLQAAAHPITAATVCKNTVPQATFRVRLVL